VQTGNDAQGKPTKRTFLLTAGTTSGTFKIKFAGQQAVTKLPAAKKK
jgi:hypothetical protein